MGAVAVIAAPIACCHLLLLKIQYWRLVRRMRDKGRYISWGELETRLLRGEGTLIVEQAQKQGHRTWWTDDRLMETTPYTAPQEESLDYCRLGPPDPFVFWCFRDYLDPREGRALLTDPPYTYPPGFVERKFFSEKFPDVNVVMTVKLA